jgi:hypothetical protein
MDVDGIYVEQYHESDTLQIWAFQIDGCPTWMNHQVTLAEYGTNLTAYIGAPPKEVLDNNYAQVTALLPLLPDDPDRPPLDGDARSTDELVAAYVRTVRQVLPPLLTAENMTLKHIVDAIAARVQAGWTGAAQ